MPKRSPAMRIRKQTVAATIAAAPGWPSSVVATKTSRSGSQRIPHRGGISMTAYMAADCRSVVMASSS